MDQVKFSNEPSFLLMDHFLMDQAKLVNQSLDRWIVESCETCNHCEINESGDDGGIHDIFHN